MSLVKRVQSILSSSGKLVEVIDGFESRQAQSEMAEAVAESIDSNQTFLAEAGTGTGKTFAYLVPSLLSGKKVIISTATKNLQEQLLTKDIPLLMDICEVEGQAKLLKGRENYLCSQRLEISETTEQHPKHVWKKLALIREWQQKTRVGDKAELAELDENDPIWSKVTSRMEFCQTNECTDDDGCFYPAAKKQAQEAQILVVNHHLFCADLALREQGFGEILPEADIYIFDEAHQLPDIAAQFLGFSISRGQLDELARDITVAQKKESPESVELDESAKLLEKDTQKFNEALGKFEKRWTWQMFQNTKVAEKALQQIRNQLSYLIDQIKPLTDRGKQLSAIYKRSQEIHSQLSNWLKTDSENQVRWLESSQARFKLQLTPLSVAEPFSRQREAIGGSWIFTSATLAVNHSFDYFSHRLGLEQAKVQQWESPFDYETQALIYHPIGLPEPKSEDYIKICLRAAWPLLQASEGRAFLLFTSYRALAEAKSILEKHWQGQLFAQGDAPKNDLLNQFKQTKQAILLGTSSFWEGVDVKGDALKLVMIDRIPFIPPDDPLVQARETALKEKGLNGFFHFQIPEASIALKQGAGRLIRSTEDRGVLMLCDPRLTQKSYGRILTGTLPPFKWAYDGEEAKKFLLETMQLSDEKQS